MVHNQKSGDVPPSSKENPQGKLRSPELTAKNAIAISNGASFHQDDMVRKRPLTIKKLKEIENEQ